MQTLEWVNEQLSYYRNSDYKWERELITEFEKYFDREFSEFLSHKNLCGMDEGEKKEIFYHSLRILFNIIHSYEYYVGDEKDTLVLYFHSMQHPATKKDLPLNKEKAEKLFIMVTMPFRNFEKNIYKHLINYAKSKVDIQHLNQDKQFLDAEVVRLESTNQTRQEDYNKLVEDIQKERRESINRMPFTYIDACEYYNTDKPTLSQLEYISAIPEKVWGKALANPIFLLFLLEKLKEKWAQAKEKREFWWGAYNVIDNKHSEVKKRLKYKTSQLSETDYEQIEKGSKQQKIKAAEIKADKEIGIPHQDAIKNCEICGDEIRYGNLCRDCNEAFKVKGDDKSQAKTKIEKENDERIQKAIDDMKAKQSSGGNPPSKE